MPILIFNPQDLIKIKKDQIAVVSSKVGIKNKIEIAKKAAELKIKINNLNSQEFLNKMAKIKEEKKKGAVKGKEAEKEVKAAKGNENIKEKAKPEEHLAHEHLIQKQGEKKNA